MDKQHKLTPDQFQFDDNGNLLINRDEIAQVIQHQADTEKFPPEEARSIKIDVA